MEVDANTLVAAAAAGPTAAVAMAVAFILQTVKNWRGTHVERTLSSHVQRQDEMFNELMARLLDQNSKFADWLMAQKERVS